MSARLKAYFYLTVAALLWGIASPVIKYTLDGISPLHFLTYRFLIAAVFAIIYFSIAKPKLPKKAHAYLNLGIYGFVAVPLALGILFFGLDKSTVLEFGLIGALGPLTVALGGAIFLREKIENHEKIGMTVAFLGTLFTVLAPIFSNQLPAKLFTGNIFIILFLIADSAGVLLAKRLTNKHFDALTMTNAAFIIGAIVMTFVTFVFDGPTIFINNILNLELRYHLGVWYMALISGTFAYFIFIKGERMIEASEAGLFFYLNPLFSFPLAIYWLGEKPTSSFVVGAIIIATGVVIAEHRPQKTRFRRKKKKLPHPKLH